MSTAEELIRFAFKKAGRENDPKLSEAIEELEDIGMDDPRDAAYWAMSHIGLVVDHDTLKLQPCGVDPDLQARMKSLFDRARELKNQAQVKEREAHEVARAAVIAKKGIGPENRIELSFFHNCDGSPTGYCAYDLDSEHGSDECLFCGHPDERL
jgi:hypothetical protein